MTNYKKNTKNYGVQHDVGVSGVQAIRCRRCMFMFYVLYCDVIKIILAYICFIMTLFAKTSHVVMDRFLRNT